MKDIEVVKWEKSLEGQREVYLHEDLDTTQNSGRLFFLIESEEYGDIPKTARQVFTKEILAAYHSFGEIRDTKTYLQEAIKKANAALLKYFEEHDIPGNKGLMVSVLTIEKNRIYHFQVGTQPFIIWRNKVPVYLGSKHDPENPPTEQEISLRETMRLPFSSVTDDMFIPQETILKNGDLMLITSSDLIMALSSTDQVRNLVEDRSASEIRDEIKRATEAMKTPHACAVLCIRTNDVEQYEQKAAAKTSHPLSLPKVQGMTPFGGKQAFLVVPIIVLVFLIFVFGYYLLKGDGVVVPPEESSVTLPSNIIVSENAGEAVWLFEAPAEVSSSPIVDGRLVYFGCKDNFIYALDTQTGQIQWRFKTEDGIGSTPTVHDSILFVGSYDFHMYALNKKDGRLIWRYRTDGKIISSPTVAGDKIIFGSHDYRLHAVYISSGDKAWTIKTQNIVWAKPLVIDQQIYFASVDGYLYCCTFDGEPVWRNDIGKGTYGLYSSPVSNGISIFLGSKDGSLYAINRLTGEKEWNYQTGGIIRSSPAISAHMLFVGSEDGYLYAVNTSGEEIWKFNTGGGVNSSPCLSNGVVYVGSDDHKLYAIEATSGIQRWSYDMESSIYSSPAVGSGVVYVGSEKGKFAAISTGGL